MRKELLKAFLSSLGVLRPDELELIADNTVVQNFKKGTILLREGQVSNKCYAILEGCIRSYYLIDGEEKSTAFFTEGQPVTAFTSYVNQKPTKQYLECVEDCVLTVGNQDLEKEMCNMIPRLDAIIRAEVEKEAGKKQDEFAFFMTSSPEERYLNLLERRPELFNRVPQHQLASYIGVKPESLSRIRKRIAEKRKSNSIAT